ncbi:MAG TPA: hypothetical protein VIL34_16575 [Actinopolymorphaceae bacterium]|mgnify:CR=1 FL=1
MSMSTEAPSSTSSRRDTAYMAVGCLVMLVLVVLACTGFYWLVLRDPYADQGVPVTRPATGLAEPTPQIPKPEGGLPAITYELQEQVVKTAGVSKPTTATCEVSKIPMALRDFDCTVTYEGLEVPFTVTITDVTDASAIGMSLFEWKSKAHKVVITRQGVFDSFWRENVRAGEKNMRCDGHIPRKALVRPGRTGYYCYSTSRGGTHNRWEVTTNEHGLQFVATED